MDGFDSKLGAATTPSIRAGWTHYRTLAAVTVAVILLVFIEPTARRLLDGQWQRGRFVYVSTTSLDVHALMGYTFLVLVVAQVWLGWRQARSGRPCSLHGRLGRALVFAVIPAFVAVGMWVVLDRSTSIAPEVSVIFKHHRPVARVALFELLGGTLWLVIRSVRAIARGDLDGHVDAFLAAFMFASAIAYIRFFYFLFWAIRGGCPLSVVGMFFVSVAVVLGLLCLVYARAGRLRANRLPIMVLAGCTLALALGGWSHYTMLDPDDLEPTSRATDEVVDASTLGQSR